MIQKNPLEIIISLFDKRTKKQKTQQKIKDLKKVRDGFQRIVDDYDHTIERLEWEERDS